MSETLKPLIDADVKAAMRARDRRRVAALRLVTAGIKQREVDTREDLDDAAVLAVLDKMAKQRRESIVQFEKAGREDLVDQERYELELIRTYMPEPLGEAEVAELIEAALAETGAGSMKEMGRVMGLLKPRLQGRADIGAVSALVRRRLAGS